MRSNAVRYVGVTVLLGLTTYAAPAPAHSQAPLCSHGGCTPAIPDIISTLQERPAIDGRRLLPANPTMGDDEVLESAVNQLGYVAMTSLAGSLYIVQNDRLHLVDSNTGAYRVLGSPSWGGLVAMTSLNGSLYIVQNSRLHKVDPGTGDYQVVGTPAWAGKVAMTSIDETLYIVQNDRLHRVDPSSGTWHVLGSPAWQGSEAMTSLNGSLYIVQNSRLHQVDPSSGAYKVLGTPAWSGKVAMTSLNGSLYIAQNSRLHRVDPATGAYQVLGSPSWSATEAMTALNSSLYIVQNRRLHQVDTSDGRWLVLGGELWGGLPPKGVRQCVYNKAGYVARVSWFRELRFEGLRITSTRGLVKKEIIALGEASCVEGNEGVDNWAVISVVGGDYARVAAIVATDVAAVGGTILCFGGVAALTVVPPVAVAGAVLCETLAEVAIGIVVSPQIIPDAKELFAVTKPPADRGPTKRDVILRGTVFDANTYVGVR